MCLFSELICVFYLKVFFSLLIFMLHYGFICFLYSFVLFYFMLICFVLFYLLFFFQTCIYMISFWLHFKFSKMLFNLNSLCIKVNNKIINSDFLLWKKRNFTLLQLSACCSLKFMSLFLWHIHSCQLRQIQNWHSIWCPHVSTTL